MGKKCIKCGYERQPTDTAPDYECPNCGVVYAKVEGRRYVAPASTTTNANNAEATKKCPYCGEEILAVAKKCKHCQSDLTVKGSRVPSSSAARPGADYGIFLLAVPVVATMLMWFWVGNLNLLQSPAEILSIIGVATVALTALIAAMEASQVGMTSNRKQGTYSPVAWFFIILLMWVIGYPAYLFKRRKFGLANFLLVGLLVAVVFVASQVLLALSIEHQKDKVRGILGFPQANPSTEELSDLEQKNLEATLDLYRLETGSYPSSEQGLEALVHRPEHVVTWNGPYLRESSAHTIYKFDYQIINRRPVLTPK